MTAQYHWGPWKLNPETMTLDFSTAVPRWEHLHYEIDLVSINTSAQMLDWIFQVHAKPWADPPAMKSLLDAFNAIFMPQSNLCSLGADHRINARALLSPRFAGTDVS